MKVLPSQRSNEEKSKLLDYYLIEAKKHNAWVEKAKHNLLTNIGPKLAKLEKSGYYGCGFHYALEQDFAKLIGWMSMHWDPCMNWIDKCSDDDTKAMIARVVYDSLIESVKKAEKSAKKR